MKSCRATLLILPILALLAVPGVAQIVDNFNRTTGLGSNWTADPEYQIVNNTLDNTATATAGGVGWSYMALYNAAVNPYEVQFTWAPSATPDGINAAGFAMFMDANSPNANGLLIFRRNDLLEINPIVNGAVDRNTPVDTSPTSRTAPVAGSIVKIVLRTDATKVYIDFYINGSLDGTLDYLRSSRPIPSTYYAGICLYSNMANNIDDFTVRARSVTVVSPNGGESWLARSVHPITWSALDFTSNVAIDFSSDGGATWSSVAASAGNTGTYSWTLPASTTTQGRIRVKDATSGLPSDISNANFTIEPEVESITVLAPNGGESWVINSQQQIRWSASSAITFVNIAYAPDGVNWVDLAISEPNDGTFNWTVPGPATTQGLIRVSDAFDNNPVDQSNAAFSTSTLVTLRVKDSSGQPGTTNNVVTIWLDNQTPIRGLSFKLSDSPNNLNAMSAAATGRAAGFSVTMKDDGNTVTIFLLKISSDLIPNGSGPVCQINYNVLSSAALGDFSSLDLTSVDVADANNAPITPDLVAGKFWFVKMGDLDSDNDVDLLDINRAADIVLGKPPVMTPTEMLSGDVDHNGLFDLFDLLTIYEAVY